MSAVRFFDNVPHIVRYGMHDETDEKCSIWFWRNGVRFTINVKKDDVQGTAFYREWKPLLRKHKRGDGPLSQWVHDQWHPLCDLLISSAMPVLKELAPDRSYWVTLRDYLHTPAYKLRLVAAFEQVDAKIEDGPTDTSAYELAPVLMSDVSPPADLQQYFSNKLFVLNQERDWRRGPEEVRCADGRNLSFLGCRKSSKDVSTGKVSNSSLSAINAYLRLAEIGLARPDKACPEAIPAVCGIVTDEPAAEASTPHTDLGTNQQPTNVSSRGFMVAGILLSWPSSRETIMSAVQKTPPEESHRLLDDSRVWRARIGEALDYLHAHGIYLGGREDWPLLNAYSVFVDADGKAWLALSAGSSVDGTDAGAVERACEFDNKALAELFDTWLPNALASKPSD